MILPALSPGLQAFIAVDEGLDQLIRVAPSEPATEWTLPLKDKCRTLQLLPNGNVMAVTDSGYLEVEIIRGTIVSEAQLFPTGVISAQRLLNGHTFFGGLNLHSAQSVTFVQVDETNPRPLHLFWGRLRATRNAHRS